MRSLSLSIHCRYNTLKRLTPIVVLATKAAVRGRMPATQVLREGRGGGCWGVKAGVPGGAWSVGGYQLHR